ncbi:MAG: type I restriction-modification system subunit M [Bacteroidota bacterium]
MAIKKNVLYSALWRMCDKLRGGMDASQYKDYVLVLLAIKYVTDKAKISKEFRDLVKLPKGASFDDILALKGKDHIGEEMNKVIARFAEAMDLQNTFKDTDFNDAGKLGNAKDRVKRLTALVAIFEDEKLNLGTHKRSGDDILGDAYEYFMKQFATQSGKSKGQFYTPAEVSRLMAKLLDLRKATPSDTVYDPTCGSGSLLLKAADETPEGITMYGQEKDRTTANLAQLNMIVHNQLTALEGIKCENTLSKPLHLNETEQMLKKFDFIVANPPFSDKDWSIGVSTTDDPYHRFKLGIPPKKNGDYAFLLHILAALQDGYGQAAVILPHGVLFRGNAEALIRKNLIRKGYIKAIIGLPPNLFYGTGIPACIILLDKQTASTRRHIFMIDAAQGFIKDGNKNRLRAQDIHKIVDTFRNRTTCPKYSRNVPIEEISNAENDFNLNIPRYIDTIEDEDLQDIQAHLQGGIPADDIAHLASYWEAFPTLQQALLTRCKDADYYRLHNPVDEIIPTLAQHPAIQQYRQQVAATFQEWCKDVQSTLEKFAQGSNPKKCIHFLSEKLLKAFAQIDLLDAYSLYQGLMDYWEDTLQDDCYTIAMQGWQPEITMHSPKKKKEWDCDLLPKTIGIEHFFATQQAKIDTLKTSLEEITQQLEQLHAEQVGEEDIFSEVKGHNGKITKILLEKRLKNIAKEPEHQEEYTLLTQYQSLCKQESNLKSQCKKQTTALDEQLLRTYRTLTAKETQQLVIHHKWFKAVAQMVEAQVDQVYNQLADRLQTLAARYATPLPQLTQEVDTLTQKVTSHLNKMGFQW